MNQSGTDLQSLGKHFKALLLASLLYPLQRVQSIQQVQSSYANQTHRNTQQIVSQAIHHGRKSYFRGLSTFTLKAALLTTAIRSSQALTSTHSDDHLMSRVLQVGVGAVSYLLFYPLQVINIRMSVEVQKQRFYQNVRSCASKIKRNQGIKTFYRGFAYSCLLFTGQLAVANQALGRFDEMKRNYSEWQQIAIYMGIIAATQTLIYPLTTIKKLYQVNGALGHTDQNQNILRTIQTTSLPSMLRGINTKMINLFTYTLLYSWCIADKE